MTHLFPTYSRLPVSFVRGQGARLYDADGREYIDFASGIGVTNLGHAHPQVTAALQQQAAQLMHCSNLYEIPIQSQVAAKLAAVSGLAKTFFCNSGAEANEAAIKTARRYAQLTYGPQKHEILVLEDAFHGRTMGALAATPRAKFQDGFAPLLPGFVTVPKQLDAVAAAITPATCAILVEPVQGEGGVLPLPTAFLQGLRTLCDQHSLLLIFDEVQTGIGRTGTLFAFEQSAVRPDLLTLAKGLGNGVPVGALLATEATAAVMTPGTHGSTFGGNPLAMAAALATLTAIEEENLLAHAQTCAAELTAALETLAARHPHITGVRGLGLMQALVFDRPIGPLVQTCLDYGLLVLSAGETALRLLPPLVITTADIALAIQILEQAIAEIWQETALSRD